MNNLRSVFLFLIVSFLLVACSKDESITDSLLDSNSSSRDINSVIYSLETPIKKSYINKYLFRFQKELEVNDELLNKHNNLGVLHPNYSLLDGGSSNSTDYGMLSIPYLLEGKVNGIVTFLTLKNSIYTFLSSREEINQFIDLQSNGNDMMIRSNIINKLCIYDRFLSPEIDNTLLHGWLYNLIAENSNAIEPRSNTLTITTWLNTTSSEGKTIGSYVDQTTSISCEGTGASFADDNGGCFNCDVTGWETNPLPPTSGGVKGGDNPPPGPTLLDNINGILDELPDDLEDCINNLSGRSRMTLEFKMTDLLNSHPCVDNTNINDIIFDFLNSLCNATGNNPSTSDIGALIESGVSESTDAQSTTPSIGINQFLCQSIFTINSVNDAWHVSAGITGFSFQAENINEELVSINHTNVWVKLNEDISNCTPQHTHQSLLADAFNLAIADIRSEMENFTSYEELNFSISSSTGVEDQDAFLLALNSRLGELLDGCDPNGSSYNSYESLHNNWSSLCNVQFNQLQNNNISGINGCQ